ncbi:MAG: hypothetical protein V2B18_19880 [Pseudomonadota bacterium]
MTQSAFRASAGKNRDTYDFNKNYRYLKKLLQDLKSEDSESLRREIFGESEHGRNLNKKEMKQLFKFLRKIEHQYDECKIPPIPRELEDSIRGREVSEWLPWEQEVIAKADAWREEIQEKRMSAREMLEAALEAIRRGEKPH